MGSRTNDNMSQNDIYQYDQIKAINAEIAAFMGLNHKVTLNMDSRKIEVGSRQGLYPFSPDEIRTITKDELVWFRSKLAACRLLHWEESYHNSDILDGMCWEIKVTFASYCKTISGCNQFPKEWDAFCQTISKLSGIDFN